MSDTIDWHKKGGTTQPDFTIPDPDAPSMRARQGCNLPCVPEPKQRNFIFTLRDVARDIQPACTTRNASTSALAMARREPERQDLDLDGYSR